MSGGDAVGVEVVRWGGRMDGGVGVGVVEMRFEVVVRKRKMITLKLNMLLNLESMAENYKMNVYV